MKKNKKSKYLIGGFIVFLVIILIILISFSKSSSENTKLNLTEKKWIENNKKNVVNLSVVNNIPVFSAEGEGVFFDFISNVEDLTGLTFNLIPYEYEDGVVENDLYFEIVKGNSVEKLSKEDLVFFKDYYVLVSKKEEKITSPSEIINKKIGVLTEDLSKVSYYITSESNVSYTNYQTIEELKEALTNNAVNYIAIPKNRYLDYIVSNSYSIVYNMTELKEAYVLKAADETNKNLASIIKKNFITYKNEQLQAIYNEYLMNLFLTQNSISDKSKADFLSKKYVFGYIENEPYTNVINNNLIGLDSTYINAFSELTGSSFVVKKYRSVKDLSKALNKAEVDIAPSYYDYSGLSGNYAKTASPYDEEYVVLTHKDKTDVVVNSAKSLSEKEVISVNSTLSKFLEQKANAKVKTYDRINVLLNKIDKDSVVVLDKNVYEMYSNDELANYRVIYSDKEDLEYGYIIRDAVENKTFKDLFSLYIKFINHKQLYNVAWKEFNVDSKEVSHTYFYIIGALVVLFIIWLFANKKIKIKKNIKRQETIRYIDPLTSLKNRNYLNKNFKNWENNSIYPQAIIVINLNNLRHVNDVYGHEEGDKLIRLAANVLIKNQLDQSDIIRTDGNEYLIYMVGYEKNKVVAYMRKLYKELGELPYGYGATLGYSMIEDDIKTIDDAINEAVLEIRANKEMNNKNK